MTADDAPLLVTLGFDPPTFGRLDRLRSHYFPPDRNVVPAHLMLFHHLPGAELDAVDQALALATRGAPPIALDFARVRSMGRGMMLPVDAPGLASIRSALARDFGRWLTPQDRQPYRPHVTIMNKAEPVDARAALDELQAAWSPWSGLGDRLILWRYLGGPWDEIRSYPMTAGSPVAPG